MPVPVTTQIFDAFLGTQEGIHSIALPDIFSSGGSKNLFIDKYARAKKISGYAKQNATALTYTGASTPNGMKVLIPYRSTGGGSTTRQLLAFIDEGSSLAQVLHMSTDNGATWNDVYVFGSDVDDIYPDSAQFDDRLYITSGKDAPIKWNGSAASATGRTQSPTPTAVASSSAGLLNGTYNYKLVSVFNDGSRGAGSVASSPISLTDKQMDLTWTADADTDVVGYELYRTSGTGVVFYYADYINTRTTAAYTDNIPDLTILENRVMAEHGDAPPTTYHCEPHKQRMWYGRSDAFPTRVWWSDPGLPEDVYTYNYLDFSDSETVGDKVVGMVGNVEGKMVVLSERAVWTVSGTGQVIGNIVDWTRVRTNAQIGATSSRAAVKVPAGAIYTDQDGRKQATNVVTLAYLTPLLDVRLFDGDNDIIISNPVKTTLADLNYASREAAFCVTDTPRGEITWVFPTGSSGVPNQGIVWNYRWGVWYTRDWAFAHAVEIETSTDASILLAGSSIGSDPGSYCYLLWSGDSFDGTAIEAVWMTKTLFGVDQNGQPTMSNQKRWRWVDFLFETEQTTTLTVEWLTGASPDNGSSEGSTTITPAAADILTTDGDILTSATGDHLVVSQQSTSLMALLKDSSGNYLHNVGMRLRIGDNASNGSWSIEAMTVAYQILPGLERRMP